MLNGIAEKSQIAITDDSRSATRFQRAKPRSSIFLSEPCLCERMSLMNSFISMASLVELIAILPQLSYF